ncbi:type II toxin-antitoxin system HicB family antitoxin [Oricola thermophila]|uniref:Type II toxin-antitoxin system HicB family antitoxin n=1 Tax=Oricola thermophila TaxID=2742145 RepID=A0A6N1VIE6_9HYPH|nr:type II toxin-antitoxin system HicB family antitoxin [Oricola thermophila]QKV18757.1 type II toxin-antitoxin system HicB family antitoxin [Oricola thermophila]
MAYWYEVTLSMDELEDGTCTWLVTAPDFPEVTTYGDTQEEACRNGLKAIEEAIAARMADGEDVPPPLTETNGKGRYVGLSALIFLKACLYMLCREQGITRAELARRLGRHRNSVDRLFILDHKSQLDQLEEAFAAIGHPLSFDIGYPAAA